MFGGVLPAVDDGVVALPCAGGDEGVEEGELLREVVRVGVGACLERGDLRGGVEGGEGGGGAAEDGQRGEAGRTGDADGREGRPSAAEATQPEPEHGCKRNSRLHNPYRFMTDKHAAIAALSAASRACTDALAAIGARGADSAPGDVVLADLDALLALVHHIATKLALALKPGAPSYAAAIPILHELAQHPPALAHCACLLHDHTHGAALTKDVTVRVSDILDALRAVLQTFLNNAARGPHLVGSGAAGEEYLVRTAALHDRITDARGPSGIPKDNQTAVYRAWSSDRDTLDDNLQEITRMINDAESDQPPDDVDDGWGELEYTTSTSMSKHELARAKNVLYPLPPNASSS